MCQTTYLVDDDDVFRRAAATVLEESGCQVVPLEGGPALFEALDRLTGSPRCLLLESTLAEAAGVDVPAALPRWSAAIPVVLVSRRADVSTAVEAIRNGAVDFLTKPVARPRLLQAVQTALECDRRRAVLESLREEFQSRLQRLSPREREVLELTIAGRNSKEMAAQLAIGVQTVLKHHAQMLSKMQVRNDVELAVLVKSVPPPPAVLPAPPAPAHRW